jgi:hypothetical protein
MSLAMLKSTPSSSSGADLVESLRWEVSLLVEERPVDCFDPKQPCELHLVDFDSVVRHPSDAREIEVIQGSRIQ